MILPLFTELFPTLSSQARRSLARHYFPAFYERGYTANQALAALREAGLGYRRQDFLRDYREGRSAYLQRTKVRFVRLDRTPTEGILEAKYHGVPDRYSFVFRIELENVYTNEREVRHFYYHRNTLRTRGEMEREAAEWYADHYEWVRDYKVVGIAVREGYVNPIFEGI